MADDLSAVCARLSTIPWAARLLSAENQTVMNLPIRELHKTDSNAPQNKLFRETLNSSDTIADFVILWDDTASPDDLVPELRGIFTVRDGVSGFSGVVHGGAVAAILDEVMGSLNGLNIKRKAVPGGPYMTAYLHTAFKAPIRTNATYLSIGRVDKVEGRKFFVSQTIEDGEGKVLASAEAMFLRIKEGL